MSAIPIAVPLVWSTTGSQHKHSSENQAALRSDCLAHQEIFR